jgi:glutathione-regulated potassium-efflux system ancillary protein KefF
MASDAVLVLYAHPTPQRARASRLLVDAARAVDGVRVRDLYETYPDFFIDAAHERHLVESASSLVFLHPIRWYSMPSLLKEWLDVVFEPRWAYACNDGALKGKDYWLVATTGSGPEAYRSGALHGRPFHDFLAPFEQTAALCGMRWRAPLVLHGVANADEASLQAQVAQFRTGLAELTTRAAEEASAHGT